MTCSSSSRHAAASLDDVPSPALATPCLFPLLASPALRRQNTWTGKLAVYTEMLGNVTDLLLASGAKRILYILTTPFEADELDACGPYCNLPNSSTSEGEGDWPQPTNGGNGRCGPPQCAPGSLGCGVPNATAKAQSPDPSAPGCGPPTHAVTALNTAARGVMAARNVSVFDLNSVVHAHCGEKYASCSLCDNETQYMGIECGYHYSSTGVAILAQAVADAVAKLLRGT